MNTVRILISATFALLVGALVHSYITNKDTSQRTSKTSEPSLSELQQRYESLKLENARKSSLYNTKPINYTQYTPAPPVTSIPQNTAAPNPEFVNPLATENTSALPAPPEDDELNMKLMELEEENQRLKEQKAFTESENEMLEQEAEIIQDEILAAPPVDSARAAAIAGALVMARVQVYDPKSGILVLDLVRPQNITPSQVLGIRRGNDGGIIGRISMGRMEGMVGYADPLPGSFFGQEVDIQVGDDIIVIP